MASSVLIGIGLGVGGAQAAQNYEQQVIALTNDHRAANGCGEVTNDAALAEAAQRHSDEMAEHNNLSHTSMQGEDPGQRIVEAGYPARKWAENIAYGYPTPHEVVTSWMDSSSHRANILDCGLVDIGVAYAVSNDGLPYWTQDFGAPQG